MECQQVEEQSNLDHPTRRHNICLLEDLYLNHTTESSAVQQPQPGKKQVQQSFLGDFFTKICISEMNAIQPMSVELGFLLLTLVFIKNYEQIIRIIYNLKSRGNLTLKCLLTPVLKLCIRLSCPVVLEKYIFKFPGPTSMVSFCGLSIAVRSSSPLSTVSLQNTKYKPLTEKNQYVEIYLHYFMPFFLPEPVALEIK